MCLEGFHITKVDRVNDSQLTQVKDWLSHELSEGVKVVPCQNGKVGPSVLLGFNAAVEDNLEHCHSHHEHEEDHEHDDDITSLPLPLSREFEPKALIRRLTQLVSEQEIYRIKGFVAVPNKPMRLVLNGVGNRFDYFYDRLWNANDARQTKLVIIGHALNEPSIRAAFL